MGVIYIGDRATGKTALATELANNNPQYVTITNPSYQELRSKLIDTATDDYFATPVADVTSPDVHLQKTLQVSVTLPAGTRLINVDWLDTPGEVWRPSWRTDPNRQIQWQNLVKTVQKSETIMLILNPYRELIQPHSQADLNQFPVLQQWCNRFELWVSFFQRDCPKVRNIVICLNKADLFCENLEEEAQNLAFNPYGGRKNWFQRNDYVTQRYFYTVIPYLTILKQKTGGIIYCFITTIHNRTLLELPWIYLASHLPA